MAPRGYLIAVEPTPETLEAMEELGQVGGSEPELLGQLLGRSDEVLAIVPDCIGISIASVQNEVVFTVVASTEEIALMDALQYLTGGPCVDGVAGERVLELDQAALMDEDEWRVFARASAARGVASTLTLPILEDGVVVGSVNLYGGSGRAFTGHHEALARIFDAWAPGAVTNADLDFTTRRMAEQAPQRIRDERFVRVAVGIIAAAEGVDPETAFARLENAADRAGVTPPQLARELIDALDDEDGDDDLA
jgi:GAF domain-containing protein